MPLSEETRVVQLKYAAPVFGKMSQDERKLSAFSLLLKIHAITGWTIPATDQIMDVLVEQFEKKLNESYRLVNAEEIEYAFRNRGLDTKDWGKALNLTMIDEIMIPYLATRFELSRTEESQAASRNQLDTPTELTDEDWDEWLKDIENYDLKLIPCAAYDYLVKKEKLVLTNAQKHEYMDRAVAQLTGTLDPLTQDGLAFLAMKKEGKYSASITSSLVTISKRLAVKDYFLKKQMSENV